MRALCTPRLELSYDDLLHGNYGKVLIQQNKNVKTQNIECSEEFYLF